MNVTMRWKAVEQYFTVAMALFVFNFSHVVFLENVSILDLVRLGAL